MEKSFMKCMAILPLMSCNQTIGKYFHENTEMHGKCPRKYRSFGKYTSIGGNFPCIDGDFPRMIS
jgi:hypothetical protein